MLKLDVQHHHFKSLRIEETSLKNINKVLSMIRFFPFLYKKHPFCYTMYYLDQTYILLVKGNTEDKSSSIEATAVYQTGKNLTVEWSPTENKKTTTVKGKEYSYDLISIDDLPFTGVNVDPKQIH